MANRSQSGGVPAIMGAEENRPAPFETITNENHYDYDGSNEAEFAREPPIEIVINPSELKEKILDYLSQSNRGNGMSQYDSQFAYSLGSKFVEILVAIKGTEPLLKIWQESGK